MTRADVARLGRRQQQPTRQPGELLAVWVGGKLVNTKNARLHHMAEHRYRSGWYDAVALALLEQTAPGIVGRCGPDPKRVTVTAIVARRMDSQDGLRVACAPIIDALGRCGILTGRFERAGRGDEDARGHVFEYEQRVDRTRRGVEIRVALLPAEPLER